VKEWRSGDRARISESAFPGSDEPCDVAARGQVGVLIEEIDSGLWLWRSDSGVETAPTTEELQEE